MNNLNEMIAKTAAEYYQLMLLSPKGKAGVKYLEGRNINRESILRFKLGLAGAKKDGLVMYLREKGFSSEAILESGLAYRDENRALVDKFVNRIMIPILNAQWKIIGFGGRTIVGESPIYLNSMDSVRFRLNNSVFGLNIAKDTQSDYMIICEGFMDVISLHQAGFDMAVASFGMKSTYGLAYELTEYVDNIVIAYDNDDAGRKAAYKVNQWLHECGVETYYLDLGEFRDPDELLRNGGKAAFEDRLNNKIHIGKVIGYADFCAQIGKIDSAFSVGQSSDETEDKTKRLPCKKRQDMKSLKKSVMEMLEYKSINYDVEEGDITEFSFQRDSREGILTGLQGSIYIDEEYNTCVSVVYPGIRADSKYRRELEAFLFRLNSYMAFGMWQVEGREIRYVRSAIFPGKKVSSQMLYLCLIKDVFDVVERFEKPILDVAIGNSTGKDYFINIIEEYMHSDRYEHRFQDRLFHFDDVIRFSDIDSLLEQI